MVLRRTLAWSVVLCGLLVAVVLASAAIGYAAISPLEVAYVLLNRLRLPAVGSGGFVWARPFTFEVPTSTELIVRQIRLPRIALGAIVGFALALAGAVAFIVLPLSVPFGRPAFAFGGALVAAFLVYAIATESGHTPVATLLLAGIALQTFLGAVISFLLLGAGDNLETAVYWLMGHLHDSTWGRVRLALPIVVVLFVVLLAYARDLNVLLLGEEDAHTLGIEVERTKRVLLATSSIVTAAAVAVSGVIGFVGLIVPHMMRLVVGPDHRILLPTSALAGAVFLVATDTIARSGPAEIPVGIVTAALGAPFFLYLLRKREVHAL